MNFRHVLNQFALLLLGLAAVMLVLAGVYFGIEHSLSRTVDRAAEIALFLAGGAGLIVGGAAWLLTRKGPSVIGRREAMLLVAMSWVVGAAFAGLPSFLWARMSTTLPADHAFNSFIDCYFEAMSGLTTTGATVLADIESVPPSLLLWRAMTHWLGGLGIVVLFVAVLPSLGVGGKKLFRIEAPGPKTEGLQPQIRETARVLLYIYVALTGIQTIALKIAGMSWFDAVCHTFATLATGGFSTRNASVGAYDGAAIRIIVVVFMVLAGVNFGLYYQLLRRQFRTVTRDVELRFYLILLTVSAVIIYLSLASTSITTTTGQVIGPSRAAAASEAIFTTVSIQTTTGFCTSDFNRWPFLAQAVLILLMFIGGSAGSTSGGIKVIRVWVVFRVLLAEIERAFRPNVIRPVKIGGGTVDPELKLTTMAFALGIVVLFAAGSLAVMLFEQMNPESHCTFTTASTASLASLCTIGPGLAAVGAVENYGWMSGPSKIVLSILMALGRLEVFAIIVLFSPRFWRGD